jgi:hypothetical protein
VLAFLIVNRQLKPPEKLMLKLTTKAQKNSVRLILADSITKADCYSVVPE